MKRFIILSTLILWIVLAGFAVFYANRPVSSVSGAKADFSLGSNDFYLQFDQNEEAANQRYLGKIIEVSGIVQEINTDANGEINVTLNGDALFGVSCKLNAGANTSSQQIHKGDVVTVKGICSGKLMDIVLVNCSLEKSAA
jgi:hypothetical protein